MKAKKEQEKDIKKDVLNEKTAEQNLPTEQLKSAESEKIHKMIAEQEEKISQVIVDKRKHDKLHKSMVILLYIQVILLVTLCILFAVLRYYGNCEFIVVGARAKVYVKDIPVSSIKMLDPKEITTSGMYVVDIYLDIKEDGIYNVSMSGQANNHQIELLTDFEMDDNGVYHGRIQGNQRAKIISAIVLSGEDKIHGLDIDININIEKE